MRLGKGLLSAESTIAGCGARARLLSLDVYRGLTVAAMILVTDPGTYSAVYPPLRHAIWTGGTLTDMIFPSFLFLAGMSIPFSVSARLQRGESRSSLLWHALRRCALLVALGLLLNGFPDYPLSTMRIPGILQRIGVCSLAAYAVYLPMREGETNRQRRGMVLAVYAGVLLAVYWLLLKLVPVPGFGAGRMDTQGSLPAFVDRAVFSVQHMWAYGTTPGVGVTFDPEGLLSTAPAIAAVLVGAAAGEWIRSGVSATATRRAVMLAAAGAGLLGLGLSLSPFMPVIKKIWTPTFGLVSSGFALLAFAGLFYVLDVRRWTGWTGPARVFGTNAILAFTLSTVMTTMLDRLHVRGPGEDTRLHAVLYQRLLSATSLSPVHASLLYALCIVGVNLLLLYPLYRKRLFLRL